jgi:outer membrane protein assembly factor BamB/enterochelin esterase-like enzyme
VSNTPCISPETPDGEEKPIMTNSLRRLSILGCALVLVVTQPLFAKESSRWTQFRGLSAEGPTVGGDLPDGSFGLRVEWTRALGSGYSNVWITDDKAVTMFNAEEIDAVAAFDLAGGEELWRYELGDRYAGHDGSDDGPIGTPTVSKGMVFALGPLGQLVALSLADGTEKWRRELNEENSTVPFYGYTTSPIVAGNHLIVATGGEGHAVTAFDRATGEPRWTSGDDSVSYQTPMLVELGGRQQLITVTNHYLQGLDPASGEVLWELRHSEDEQPDEAAHPTVLDDERFLIKYGRGARLYRQTGDGVEEVWQTRAFGNTYALPVLIGDHFYGFSSSVLTCVDAETGEIVWRSRELSGLGLSAVDGVLAVVSRDGELVLVDASPEGYREITRAPVLENGDYAVPSFADGRFVVRNLEQLAAVQVDRSLAPAVAAVDTTDRLRGEFGHWVASLEALPESERQAAVDTRFAAIETAPLLGESGLVHLVWRGEAEDVGVRGDFVDDGQELGLYRLEGSDLFFRSLELDPKAQYTYNFMVDFGDPQNDPDNPYAVDNGFFVSSELRMHEWPASPHLEPPADGAPRGTLDRFPFRSDILDNSREIQVWRPADYGQDSEQRYPLLVVNHGDNLLRGGLMQNVLDNLVGDSVAPVIAVFVPRLSGAEYGGPAAEDYMRFLIEELLPHLDHHYLTDPTHRAIMGPGSAGVAAVLAAFTHPDVFQRAAAQSFYPIEPTYERLPEIISTPGTKPELIYVVWSRHDYELGDGRTAEGASKELLGWLRDAEIKTIDQVADYSPGWGGWRGQYDEILAALFPLVPQE